ncbi:gpW protein [Rhodoblastus acidophilus]|uniref:GpW protein n=1 Tax=Rhodoblastus acidophilus TaxID=1074 RepID=A0A212SF93_RHOAC|nr:gpW family head-tail joining protein [Rhodoblastus acidophilus]PPQ37088.1 hypothetical protein CKO16_15980 [Rhodoblastus acidophilus]RAI16727.1 hypothetical protein CH337_19915 [Rhodoblastus acidophilus]SNB84225.1 gpW protein [Rhodoblastus acidophilus]
MAIDADTLRQRLAEAEQSLHEVTVLGATTRLRHNEKWTEFSPADAGKLRGYINDLRGQLRALGDMTVKGRPRGRRVAF